MASFVSEIDKPQPFASPGASNGGKGSKPPGNDVAKQNNVEPNKNKKLKSLRLHNSKNNKKEIFKPEVEGKVSMYVCGVTAYDYSHLGHARAAVSFDILVRYPISLSYIIITIACSTSNLVRRLLGLFAFL